MSNRLFCLFFCITSISAHSPPEKSFSTEKLTNGYSPRFMRLTQIAFGCESLLSDGGREYLDVFFSPFDFNHKKILDVGSGFGGVDIYLAEKFDVEIVGVDIDPYMTSIAEEFLKKSEENLQGNISFLTLKEPCCLTELEDASFDVVISKEMFYHVPKEEKQAYLKEMYRKLNPGGMLIISDWLQSNPICGNALERASTNKKICQYVTPEVLYQMLVEANFQEISSEDRSLEHIRYTELSCQRLANRADYIVEHFGEEAYERITFSFQSWLEAQQAGDLLCVTFFAKKE